MSERSRRRILAKVREAVLGYDAAYPAEELRASLDQRLAEARTDDLLSLFCQRQAELGGKAHVVDTPQALFDVLSERLEEYVRGPVWVEASLSIAGEPLIKLLARKGVSELHATTDLPEDKQWKEVLANASVGITGCDWLLAQTGSVVLVHRNGRPRMLSLLPPTHLVVASTRCLLPDLDSLIPQLQEIHRAPDFPAVTIVTGSSRTADIEKILIKGVHGPQNLEVFLLRESDGR